MFEGIILIKKTHQILLQYHKLRIFQSSVTFAVVLFMNKKFKDMFKSTIFSCLQINKTVCPIKFEIFKI